MNTLIELAALLERAMKQRAQIDVVMAAHGYNDEARALEKQVIEASSKAQHLVDVCLDFWGLPSHMQEPPF